MFVYFLSFPIANDLFAVAAHLRGNITVPGVAGMLCRAAPRDGFLLISEQVMTAGFFTCGATWIKLHFEISFKTYIIKFFESGGIKRQK